MSEEKNTVGFRCIECGYLGPTSRNNIGKTLVCPSCNLWAWKHQEGPSARMERLGKEIADLRAKLAAAEARAERAEGEKNGAIRELKEICAKLDAHSTSCSDSVAAKICQQTSRLEAVIKRLAAAPPQRTDGERLDWLDSAENWALESTWRDFPPPAGWRIKGASGEIGAGIFPSVRSFIDAAMSPKEGGGE